eukprot:TRINITY_DN6319_c0_g1_i1.p1 TRINITY_DN6319_c0_g1~~TRINITY_DN6319_c0_g1_i1.p1  ORF type:complete len:110 (-),score=3.30 TRINITY_DN6319_c0_g1_i1:8-337(-)
MNDCKLSHNIFITLLGTKTSAFTGKEHALLCLSTHDPSSVTSSKTLPINQTINQSINHQSTNQSKNLNLQTHKLERDTTRAFAYTKKMQILCIRKPPTPTPHSSCTLPS